MNKFGTLWKFLKPTEIIWVIFGIFFFLSLVVVVKMYREPEPDKFSLYYENISADEKLKAKQAEENIRLGEDDNVVAYAERVREASSVGLGISLFLVKERVSQAQRVLTLDQLMREFAESDLLPPDCTVLIADKPTSYGLIKTSHGIFYIRYSPVPLKVEILSAGSDGAASGAVFILRVPDTSAAKLAPEGAGPKIKTAGAWATIFEAPSNQNHYIPPPFAPVETFTAMNWQVRALQQTELSPERLRELNNYLQNRNQ